MNGFNIGEIPLPSGNDHIGTNRKKVKLKRIQLEDDKSEDTDEVIKKVKVSCEEKSTESQSSAEHILGQTIKERIKSEMSIATKKGSNSEQHDQVRSDIVDEMFRDFLAQKMELVEQEYIRKSVKLNSDDDKPTSVTDETETKHKHTRKGKRKHKKKEHKSKRSSSKKSKTSSLLSFEIEDEISEPVNNASICASAIEDVSSAAKCIPVLASNVTKIISSIEVSSDILKPDSKSIGDCKDLADDNLTTNTAKSSPTTVATPNVASPSKMEDTEPSHASTIVTAPNQKKKTVISLKISSASANLISSGEIILPPGKKKKLLEEGEVVSTGSDDSTEDSEDEDEDSCSNDISSKKKQDNDVSETGSLSDSDTEKGDSKSKKKKKKKKKKHKHKDTKVKKKKKTKKNKSGRSRSRSKSPKQRSVSRSLSRERYRERSPVCYERKWIAEKGKPMVLFTTSYRARHGMSERRHPRSRSRSAERSRDSSAPSDRRSSRDSHRFQERSRSKDRKTDKDDKDLQIDKSKLRKIAIANAVHMMKTGETNTVSKDIMAKIRSGGKSVAELTDYCKKISDKEKQRLIDRELKGDDSLSDSSQEYEDAKSEEEDFTIHHPFTVKEATNIVMNIRNSKQLPVLTPQEKVTEGAKLRLTFPVSSGSQHRAKESEWVPVQKTSEPNPSTTVMTVVKAEQATTSKTENVPPVTVIPATITTAAESAIQVAAVQVPKKDKVFPDQPKMPIDIGSIVSERLAAVRRLQRNPHDVQAISQMRTAQKKASMWAESKVLPGQFMGSTGATILSQQQLIGPDKKRQAWARKEQLTSAAPLSGGIGMLLLQKLGWKQGEGLGKNKDGPQAPLMLDVKIDRKGLSSQGEGQRKAPAPRARAAPVRDLSGKHPVSALVELCSKRRWGTPEFILVDENGPAHKKNFTFKVAVNNVEYQSSLTSNNKKQAKAQAATVCLQELGLVPR